MGRFFLGSCSGLAQEKVLHPAEFTPDDVELAVKRTEKTGLTIASSIRMSPRGRIQLDNATVVAKNRRPINAAIHPALYQL